MQQKSISSFIVVPKRRAYNTRTKNVSVLRLRPQTAANGGLLWWGFVSCDVVWPNKEVGFTIIAELLPKSVVAEMGWDVRARNNLVQCGCRALIAWCVLVVCFGIVVAEW